MSTEYRDVFESLEILKSERDALAAEVARLRGALAACLNRMDEHAGTRQKWTMRDQTIYEQAQAALREG